MAAGVKSASRHFRDATQGKEAVLVEETTPALFPCVLKYRRGCLQQTHLEQVTGSQVQQEAESRMICLTSLTLQHIFARSAPSLTTAGTFQKALLVSTVENIRRPPKSKRTRPNHLTLEKVGASGQRETSLIG